MTQMQDVILVDVMKEVVDSMQVVNPADDQEFLSLNFQPGRSAQILQMVSTQSLSGEYKNFRYPLIGMLMPAREMRGSGSGYANVRIERIIIACLTDSNKSVIERYSSDETFKTILYPCYYEFFRRLARSTKIIGNDPDTFVHTKLDLPGNKPINAETNDIIDCIEILNLEITLPQIKICL